MIHSPHFDSLPPDLQNLVRGAASRLEDEFSGVFGRETVERFVADSLGRLAATATIINYLPLLTERFSRERLRAVAKSDGFTPAGVPAVLFLCVQNAGRSQMAAGWLRHLAGDRVIVWSAGSEPASETNRAVVEAMGEVGVDITAEFPKPWTDEVVRAADVVVSMGCGDACPVYPGKRYEDWDIPDPSGLGVEAVRSIREDIRRRVEALMRSIEVHR